MSEENKKEVEKKTALEVPENITVKELAEKMEIKTTELIAELIKNKVFANINEVLDFETAEIVADDFGFELKKINSEAQKRKQQIKKNLGAGAKKRPPVVVVMGHVDHGKTTLLDKILKTNVTAGESGGITQHFSAYQVKKKGELITFLDTPGHEAFHSMRERGAYITDLAIIVIAADDGVKPQTKEAVQFAKEAGAPILVAINKIDKSEKNIEKVKKELSEIELIPEDWGGETVCVNVSAKTGEGIDELLEMIILASDMEEIKANPNSPAEGFVLESHLDPQIGPVATVLIQNGTLKNGDYVSVGSDWGRVKRIENFSSEKINKATPSMPVTIIGLNDVPMAGSFLIGEENRLMAEERASKFNDLENEKSSGDKILSTAKIKALVKSHQMKKFNIILKADVKGSLEAITQILESIKSEEVAIQILKMGVGNITETDIKMAHSSGAKIIGFNVSVDLSVKRFAEKEKVDIEMYKVIYVFKSGKKSAKVVEMIVGAKVENGKIDKASLLEILRDGEKIGKGKIKELQYNKKNAQEVKSGNNAGITYEGNVIIEEGDVLNAYKEEKKIRKI